VALHPGTASQRERPFVLFGLISLALLVSSMQGSTVSVALPDMIDDLSAPLRWVGWVVTVFTLAQAVSMPITGKLSDELGRRRVFVGGLTLFGVASIASGLAPNIFVLIVARAVQGLAGGSLLPSAYGIVGDAFEGKRAQAIGMISSIFPIGSIVGPILGGLIVEHFGWRWTFFMNGPLIAIVVGAALFIMPASPRKQSRPIDSRGAVLFGLAVLGVVYALTELSQRTVPARPGVVVVSLAVALVATVTFLRFEARTAEPLIDLQLMRRREFAFVNALNFFYGAGIFGLFTFIPLYAQVGYGMSNAESGALLTPRAIAMIAASSLAAYLLPRTGYHKPIILGLVGMAASLLVLWRGFTDVHLLGWAIPNFVLLSGIVGFSGLAFGTSGPAANNAAIELAPDQIAAITGLRGMFRSLGGTLGTAFVVLIASRAETEAIGLQQAFLTLAAINVITIGLVFGIPDQVGGLQATIAAREAAANAEAEFATVEQTAGD
jgi:EmrB/QacA subfamily drug resistance transporter